MNKKNLIQLTNNLQEAKISLVAARDGMIREKELFETYLKSDEYKQTVKDCYFELLRNL